MKNEKCRCHSTSVALALHAASGDTGRLSRQVTGDGDLSHVDASHVESWSTHDNWAVRRKVDGSFSNRPSWMGEAEWRDLMTLIDDDLFDDGFYLSSVGFSDRRFIFSFHSDIVDSVYPLDDGYRIFGPIWPSVPRWDFPYGMLANGWWLDQPLDKRIVF